MEKLRNETTGIREEIKRKVDNTTRINLGFVKLETTDNEQMDKTNSLQVRTENFDKQQGLVNEQYHTLVTARKEGEETLVNYHKEIQRLAIIFPRLEAELKAAKN